MFGSHLHSLYRRYGVQCVSPHQLEEGFAIVGDGQYVQDLMAYLVKKGLPLPDAIYVRKANANLPETLQRPEQELAGHQHQQLVLGTNAFQIAMLQRIGGMLAHGTQICDVLMDKGILYQGSPPYFWQSKPDTEQYLLLITLYPTVVVEGYLKSFIRFLQSQGIAVFVRHPLQPVTDAVLKNARTVVVWNGTGEIYQPVLAQCQRLEKRVTYAECGFFPQAKHLYFDKNGVNLNSQLRRDDLHWLNEQHAAQLVQVKNDFFAGIQPFQWHEDYLFVVLQVPNDSNVLCHSPFKRGMQGFIDFVLEKYQGQSLLFKPHPKDRQADSYQFGHGVRVNADTRSLILGASGVIGINSSVLFEAALAGVAVDCYGDSLLNTSSAEQQHILQAMVNRQFSIAQSHFDEADFARFTWFVEDGLLTGC